MPPPTASDGISRERFKRGPRNFTTLSGTIGLTNLLGRKSLATSSRLQNATIYRTNVRKTGAAGKESNNSAAIQRRIIKLYTQINADHSSAGYDVISYFRSAFIEVRIKWPKMPPPTTISRILVVWHLAWPTNWCASCCFF